MGDKKTLIGVVGSVALGSALFYLIRMQLRKKKLQKIAQFVTASTLELQPSLDSLPTTDNEELRRLCKKGGEEEQQAIKEAKAIRKGDDRAAKPYAVAAINAIKYYLKGLFLNLTQYERCILFNRLGSALYRISHMNEAKQALEKSVSLANEMIDADEKNTEGKEALATATGNLGIIYRVRDELNSAAKEYLKSLEINEELDRKERMADQYSNLGAVYMIQGELDQAEEMYQNALNIYIEQVLEEGISNQYNALGLVNRLKARLNDAKDLHLEALELDEAIENKEGMVRDYCNLSTIFKIEHKMEEAAGNYREALIINKELDHNLDYVDYYTCFICYSHEDDEFVKKIYSDLKEEGVRCWLDTKDLPWGAKIRQIIEKILQTSEKVLIALSENSINSTWVESEVELALERERQTKEAIIIPFSLDNAYKYTEVWWIPELRLRKIGVFNEWREHPKYTEAFKDLLQWLRKDQKP
jgi:tetratricopeptide (TPR) repeat protein